ncbi:general substrate transporter [Cryphonectria parasitica EP155]|uniref:General substrate transporter n=1 Tax=Cryphonectria parasitica (strain ATCC 38755 / EP155) TaxID=660469 RepID=A0A9P5CMQ5_CRYP1|nr:general substrate transporter [Cryphonectria parasitica EP155]KAF3763326.1 general substrate transporter [Cryphonectria parasitica EP155]
MPSYFGLRGSSLQAATIWAVIMPSYLLFGYNNAVAGGLLSLPSWISTFPEIDTVNTTGAEQAASSRLQGTVVALYTLGCFFGALDCIWLGDKLGRKKTIMFGAAVNFIGALLQSSSFSLGQLIVGRLVSGFGFGHLTATAPNWQAECSAADHRGAVVLLESVFISGGLAIAAWISFGISHSTGSVTWRFPLALSGFWSLIILFTTPHMPESPRWLVRKGKVQEARQTLAALNGVEPDAADVADNVAEIEESLAFSGQAKFTDIFRNGESRLLHRTCLAAAGQMFQQMSGINALAFYQETIFETDLGLPAKTARIIAASVFTWQTLCSPIGVLTVDRFGRRKLMLFAAAGMGICMAIIAGGSSQPNNNSAIAAAAAFIFMFSFFFPTGFLGLTFLYAAEIAPLSHRSSITAISTGSAWLFNFVVAEITPVGFSTIGYRYPIVYACINLFLTLPSVYFLFPETSGRHLEEVDLIFTHSRNIFDTVSMSNNDIGS